MSQEDITKLLIQWLRNPDHGDYGKYGYEVYLPALAYTYLRKMKGSQINSELHEWFTENSPAFYTAAWELCRRGILRPGVTRFNGQATADGASGNGYTITPFGKKWLEEESNNDFVPTEPERFAQILEPFKNKFGTNFHQRAQEAIRCYGAHAYLSCCVMCGAAVESILLTAAIKKSKDEQGILKKYFSRNGRHQIENLLIVQTDKSVKEEFKTYNILLKYWRDEAAHGQISKIIDNEAYTATALLLRFSIFMDRHWEEITN